MRFNIKASKERYKKNERLVNLITAFTLVVQFIAVLVTAIAAEKKKRAPRLIVVLSAIGAAVGSFFLYKEVVAPAVSKKLAKYTLGDDDSDFDFDDDFNSYADSIGEPDLSWYEDDDEEVPEESVEDEAPADEE